MKKGFILVSIFILFLNAFSVHAQDTTTSDFPDVTSDSPYYAAITYFHEKNIIQGYEDGTFRPNQEANRAEALKIILLGSDVEISSEDVTLEVFPDVTLEDWHYPYIKKAKELGIVEGYEDGYFRPYQVQNIAETLKIILLTNNIEVEPVSPFTTVYPDVSGDLWFAEYAAYAKEKNLIEPGNDAKLNAARSITRGELVDIMYRIHIVMQNNNEPFDISTNWPFLQFPQYALQTKKPFKWKIVNNEDQVVFWRQDIIHNQSSYEIPYPYSATVTFHLDENEDGMSPKGYIEQLEMIYKTDFGSFQKNDLSLAGFQAVEFNVSPVHDDYYIFFPGNQVLHAYTSYGWSDLSDYLVQEIDGIIENISYITPQDASPEDFLSEVRNRILVEGIGQETLNMFSDLINIETDTIGVGTGPIDYFYSEIYDVTLKYERSSDTILDMQNGQTSAF